MPIPLLVEKITWNIISFAISKGLDKTFSWCLKKHPLIVAISKSIDKTSNEFRSAVIDIEIRKAFGKNKTLVKLLRTNFRTNEDSLLKEMAKLLRDTDLVRHNVLSKEIDNICRKFIENFSNELPQAEGRHFSSVKTQEAMLRQGEDTNERVRRIERQMTSFGMNIIGGNSGKKSSEPGITFPAETGNGVTDDKYKKEIDTAKTLLDNKKFESAKTIYEKLLKDLASDSNAPLMVRFKVHTNLGVCQIALGLFPDAIDNHKKAYKIISPPSIIALKNRAIACLYENKPLEGLPYIDAAIKQNVDDNECLHIKAILLREGGKPEDAITLYQKNGENDEDKR